MPRLTVLALVAVVLLIGPAAAAGPPDWRWPVGPGRVDRGFDPPATPYAAGHRGVDLAGTPGTPVRSVAAGTVTFTGSVGGVRVVTVSHGRERSTYQPVAATVEVGDAVAAGEPIGVLQGGHRGCGAAACLHLGRLDGDRYLDPLDRLGRGGRYRLVDPDGPLPRPPALGGGTLAMPVSGTVSSAYGRRVHPVTGTPSLHDGIDLAAPCGTPVRAAAAGSVRTSAPAGAYGLRVEIEHAALATSYSHLSSVAVAPGTAVRAGDVVGLVGSTGRSTGCHLHFSVHAGGTTVDPAPLL